MDCCCGSSERSHRDGITFVANPIIITGTNDPQAPHEVSVTNNKLDVNATVSGVSDTNLTEVGGAPVSLGQDTMAASIPVVIASDQSALSVATSTTGTATRTQVADSATDVLLLAANAARLLATIYNDSTVALYVGLGTTTVTTTNYTVIVFPNGFFVSPETFVGQIRGIWASDPGTGGAKITEIAP